jgi:hypothetical protein
VVATSKLEHKKSKGLSQGVEEDQASSSSEQGDEQEEEKGMAVTEQ